MKSLIFKTISLLCFFSIFLNAELLIVHNSTTDRPNPDAIKEIKRLQEISNKHNLNIKFKAYPWKRALLMVEKGLADGIINASYKADRAKYAMYPMSAGKLDRSKRLNNGNTYFIYKTKNSKLTWDGKKFNNISASVGAKDSYAVIEDLKKHKNIKIVTKVREEHLFSDLIKGNIQAVAMTGNTMNYLKSIMPAFASDIVQEKQPIRKKDYYVIFSKISYKTKKDEIETLWNYLKD